ncbi:MAG: hypothetical protein KDJ80_16235 [Nitratireductor sp.]|nr:hypothetical protein [Nitratireductor sp.]
MTRFFPGILLAGALALQGGPGEIAFAQSPSLNREALLLELNRIEQVAETCSLTFLVQNELEGTIGELAFEFVLFDERGLVQDMNIFDFGSLPRGKTIVRRFRLKDTRCASVSRLLINGTDRCKLTSARDQACMERLRTTNRTDTKFGL